MIEEAGDGWLIPAHPRPLAEPPGALRLAIMARRSLIALWTAESYAARDFAYPLLRRQVCVFNDPASIKTVFVTQAERFERKGAMMRRALSPLLGDGLFISDGETWRRRRPLVADIVHKTQVPFYAPMMTGAVAELLRGWQDGAQISLLPAMAELTAQIIARSIFGTRLGAEALAGIVRGFGRYQARIDSFNLPFFLGAAEGWPVGRGAALRQAIAEVHGVVEHVITEHVAGRGEHGSMVDLLVRRMERSPGLGLDVQALRNEAATIFMAGHETTAATLTWAFYLLAKAPWAEARLHEELDRVLAGREPNAEDAANLPYARAVIEEALRLYPPVPILPRQALEATEVGGIAVEKDALVLVVPWILHRSPDLWDQPMHFRPERFLDGAAPIPYSYIPFSAGPRICAGLNFGLTEAILCLAMIARAFRLVVEPGFRADPICRLSLRPQHPILVRLEARA
ncbi:cytochrome P450 [Sediminicoccus sp. KRV36]|uniref:cytochrome P450 n=1 Tax=Sediminicoccus sp. KRV36 TaxID=3133721 RepID=UPI00200E0D72|nr:cytochrome P450 [Sediminicoccus rosea]UPY37127.1 cytochrome P450 [Sediminicoccus rosea]